MQSNLRHGWGVSAFFLCLVVVLLAGMMTQKPSDSTAFITFWETTRTGERITIPTAGTGYHYTVDWGDGTSTRHADTRHKSASHTYSYAGRHTVSITGTFPRICFNDAGDKDKILEVRQWGTQRWTSMTSAFRGCGNLQVTATDLPRLSRVSHMNKMFEGAAALNTDMSRWDVSGVTDMRDMFLNAVGFSPENYNRLLIGWAGLFSLQNNVIFGAPPVAYDCRAKASQEILTGIFSWDIRGDKGLKTPTFTVKDLGVCVGGSVNLADAVSNAGNDGTLTYWKGSTENLSEADGKARFAETLKHQLRGEEITGIFPARGDSTIYYVKKTSRDDDSCFTVKPVKVKVFFLYDGTSPCDKVLSDI